MKFTIIRTEPCQVIAAEQGTLDGLIASLRTRLGVPTVQTGAIGDMYGFPLIADPELPPGEVHIRPFQPAPRDSHG